MLTQSSVITGFFLLLLAPASRAAGPGISIECPAVPETQRTKWGSLHITESNRKPRRAVRGVVGYPTGDAAAGVLVELFQVPSEVNIELAGRRELGQLDRLAACQTGLSKNRKNRPLWIPRGSIGAV